MKLTEHIPENKEFSWFQYVQSYNQEKRNGIIASTCNFADGFFLSMAAHLEAASHNKPYPDCFRNKWHGKEKRQFINRKIALGFLALGAGGLLVWQSGAFFFDSYRPVSPSPAPATPQSSPAPATSQSSSSGRVIPEPIRPNMPPSDPVSPSPDPATPQSSSSGRVIPEPIRPNMPPSDPVSPSPDPATPQSSSSGRVSLKSILNAVSIQLFQPHPAYQEMLNVIGCMSIGVLLRPVTTYIHELGHVFANKALFKNIVTKITLRKLGFEGGFTTASWINPRTPSFLGTMFRENVVEVIMSTSGPLAEIASSIGLARLSAVPKAYFVILPSLIDMTDYAIKSVRLDPSLHPGNDFCNIKRITPVFYTFITIGIVGITSLTISNAVNAISEFCNYKFINMGIVGITGLIIVKIADKIRDRII